MDTEQLKMILDMVGQATDSAVWVAVLWIVSGKIYGLIILFSIGWFLLRLLESIKDLFDVIKYFKEVRDHYGLGLPGPLTHSEVRRVKDKINEAIKALDSPRQGEEL